MRRQALGCDVITFCFKRPMWLLGKEWTGMGKAENQGGQ